VLSIKFLLFSHFPYLFVLGLIIFLSFYISTATNQIKVKLYFATTMKEIRKGAEIAYGWRREV
jgi:hypothetical protein